MFNLLTSFITNVMGYISSGKCYRYRELVEKVILTNFTCRGEEEEGRSEY